MVEKMIGIYLFIGILIGMLIGAYLYSIPFKENEGCFDRFKDRIKAIRQN